MSETNKIKNEIYAFKNFVDIVGIDVDEKSIKQLNPPYPDIVCDISGFTHGFELTVLTDSTIERKFSTGKFHFSMFKIEIADAVKCIIRKKNKNYSMASVDLIIHEGATPIDDLWSYDPVELDNAMQKAADETNFSKIWLLDITNRKSRVYLKKGVKMSNITFKSDPR